MADSESESDIFCVKHTNNSFFNIPGFFGGKASSDSHSIKSPTTPLDFSFFTNLRSPFTKSLRSPSPSSHHKKWDCSKVGLGIVSLLANETKQCEFLDSQKKKNIIFGAQMKHANSLPRNYMILLPSQAKGSATQSSKSDDGIVNEEGPLVPNLFENFSPISPQLEPNLNSTMASLPRGIDVGSQTNNSLIMRLSSLSIPIGSDHVYAGSLSARDIELSEDYTCIISHGPNPKTTHIFGDCILECHTSELSNFAKAENLRIELPQEAKRPEGSSHYPSEDFLSFCYSCKKKLEKEDDIYMHRGKRAFCSFDCRPEEIFAEEEMEKACDNSPKSSPDSSYHEDFFLMGMQIAA